MATNTDKIDDLRNRVAKLEAQLDQVRKEIDAVAVLALQLPALKERLENLRKETETFIDLSNKVAVLEQQFKDLKEKTDESSRRRWSLVPVIVAALFGGIITLGGQAILRYLFS